MIQRARRRRSFRRRPLDESKSRVDAGRRAGSNPDRVFALKLPFPATRQFARRRPDGRRRGPARPDGPCPLLCRRRARLTGPSCGCGARRRGARPCLARSFPAQFGDDHPFFNCRKFLFLQFGRTVSVAAGRWGLGLPSGGDPPLGICDCPHGMKCKNARRYCRLF